MLPPAKRVGNAEGTAAVEVCRRFGGTTGSAAPGGRGRVPVTQASGRARWGSLRGQPAYERSLHAGRPDNINVWHAVPVGKTPRANNFSQLRNDLHG
ncbi:hypothetical protein GCM10010278_39550 [Streptomyces melanogenes]|nr:hypothetical protein GCM10010278_39550 [Streptomyces melanogenes]